MYDALKRNQAESRRLADLGATLTPEQFRRLLHGEWTIAAKLAHIAFWDRMALAHLERWAAGEQFRVDIPDWYDNVLNDSMLTDFLALDPADALRLTEAAASALDARLLGLDAAAAARLADDASRPETDASWLLHRHQHRALHLGEIEAALRQRGRI